jgi:hypothetical protein
MARNLDMDLACVLVGLVICAACGDAPPGPEPEPEPQLEVDIPARTSGLLGVPITFSVTEADGTVVASGNSTGQPFRVSIHPGHPGARLSITEDRSSSPTSRYSSSFTITDLQPGDRVLHDSRIEPIQSIGSMTLRFVGAGGLPLGSSYYFVTPCGVSYGDQGLAILSFRESCVPAGAFTIHGYVVDASGPRLHTAIAASGFQAGGTIDATEAWGAVPTRSATVRGLPPDASGVLLRLRSSIAHVDLSVPPAAGDVVVDLPVIAAPGGVATLAVVTTRTGALGVQRHLFAVDDAAPTVTLDLGAHPLPWITGPLVTAGAGVAWTQGGAGAPDFVRVADAWSVGGPRTAAAPTRCWARPAPRSTAAAPTARSA